MLPFFRKIRYKLAKNNQPASPAGRFFKYSRYAIGEIILVVVGILIALYINNWNEERKERERFDQVLIEVENELLNNIYRCRNVLNNFLFRKDSIANLILFQELTVEDYRKHPALEILGSNYIPTLKTDAINKLVELNGSFSPTQDSLRFFLNSFYSVKQEIDAGGNRIAKLARQPRKEYKKFSWYNDWLAGIPNEERLDYLANDPMYRRDVGEYINEQLMWFREDIEAFEIDGRQFNNWIFQYLESRKLEHADSLHFQYDVQKYDHYVGVYIETERSSSRMSITDSTIISIENDKLYYTPYVQGKSYKREIIPVSKNKFRTEFGLGFYWLNFDENGNVIEHVYSNGMRNRKSKKVR